MGWRTFTKTWQSMRVVRTMRRRRWRSTSWRLSADPKSALLQNGLADLYFKLGRIREAVTSAKDRVTANPNDIDAHKLLGKVYLRSLGDLQGQPSNEMLQLALGEYETLAKLQPNEIENHLLLGQLYGLNHDSAKAEAQFKLAEKIDPNSEESVLNLARLYSVQGDFQRTIDVLKGVPAENRSARIELALGGSYDQVKDWKEASAKRISEPSMLEPGNVDSERGLANSLLNEGKLDESLKEFKMVLAAEPSDVQSQMRVSDIERRQGHYEEALATLKKAKELTKDNPELSYNEALIDDSLGRYDDAVAVLTGLIDSTTHPDGKYADGEKQNRAIFLDRLGSSIASRTRRPKRWRLTSSFATWAGSTVTRGYQGEIDAYRDAHQWTQSDRSCSGGGKGFAEGQAGAVDVCRAACGYGQGDEGIALAKAQLKGGPESARERPRCAAGAGEHLPAAKEVR